MKRKYYITACHPSLEGRYPIGTVEATSDEDAWQQGYDLAMNAGCEADSVEVQPKPTCEEAQQARRENLNRLQDLQHQITDLELKRHQARQALRDDPTPTNRSNYDLLVQVHQMAQEASAGEILQRKIADRILRDNLRLAIVDEVMPVVLRVLKKYDGKRYGPKTKQAISDAVKAETGCAAYINGDDELVLVPINSQGYRDYTWSYDDLKLATPHPSQGEKLLADNVIDASQAENLYLINCPDYCPDPMQRAGEIIEAKEAMMAAHQALKAACDKFNDLLPSQIDNCYAGYFRDPMLYI